MQTQKLMDFAVERHLNGDLDEASRVYCKVLHEQPDFADAWNLSGVLAHQRGQHDCGIEYISHAITLRDDVPAYYLNLATALMAQKRSAQAEACSRKCLELDPEHKLAWNVLGNALNEQDSTPEAIQCFERAIELDETHLDAWVNLGQLYRKTNQLDLAEKCTNRTLRIDPNHPIALNNLGAIHHSQRRNTEALPFFEKALRQQPNTPQFLVNMGNTLQDLGRYKEAETAFRKAVDAAPESANAWNSLGFCYEQLAFTGDAIECYRRAIDLDPRHISAGSNYLFSLNLVEVSRDECYAAHVAVSRLLPTTKSASFTNEVDPNRPIRIGYLSPDLRRHPLVSFFKPMLTTHSRDNFELFCYGNVKTPDNITSSLQRKSQNWRSIYGASDRDVIATIKNDEIDILIDLAGHTADNRLGVFAQRAAPIQVSMLGYLNTTGLGTMDYFVTDEVRNPPSEDHYYTEEVVRLTDGCCWAAPDDSPVIQSPPVLERGYVTFGCMHRPNKLTDQTLQLWSEVLNVVPNSRLFVFHNMFQNSEELQAHVFHRCQDAGIDTDRVDISWRDDNEYMVAYHDMDILLETVPWSSGTTALESMWMGVPIPTLMGSTPCGRATASALNRIGVGELVAADHAEYIKAISELAANTERLVDLRSSLRPLMQNTICDAKPFIQQLESRYREMWQKVCDAA